MAESLHAQSDFRKGFILLLSGDTLSGEIDYQGDRSMAKICRFRKSQNEKPQEYLPKDLAGYRFTDSKFFISKTIENKKVFLEFLIKGQLNVYSLKDENGTYYYIDKAGYDLIELPYQEYIEDNQLHQSNKHRDRLRHYTKEAKELRPQIEKMGEPDRKNLVALAKDYHHAVCHNDSCIVYEKKVQRSAISIELSFGGRYFPGNPDVEKNWYFDKGILIFFSLPTENENLNIKTGLTYFQIKRPNEKEGVGVIRVPIQLEYLFSPKSVQPKIYFGCNAYLPRYVTLAAGAGLNIQVDPTILFTLNADIDLRGRYNSIAPGSALSYSLSTGLRFNLK